MKQFIIIALAILVVGTLILAGCGTPATTTVTTTTATTTVKPILLKYSTPMPQGPFELPGGLFYEWRKAVEDQTAAIGMPVKFENHFGGDLFTMENAYKSLLNGVADVILLPPTVVPGAFPLSDVMGLPMLFTDASVSSAVYWDLSQKYLVNTEYQKIHLLLTTVMPASDLHTRTKQVRTLEDLKGMKLSSNGTIATKAMELLGAVPVMMSEGDISTSLQKGMLEGRWASWDNLVTFGDQEITTYRTINIGITSTQALEVMNLDTWNSLPPEVQKIFNKVLGLDYMFAGGKWNDDLGQKEYETIVKPYDEKVGNPAPYVLPDAEKARWQQILAPIYSDWVKDMESKGLPGQAVLDDVRALVKKYSQELNK